MDQAERSGAARKLYGLIKLKWYDARPRQPRGRPERRRHGSRQHYTAQHLRHRRGLSHKELRPARRPIRAAQRRSSNDRARCHPARHPPTHVRDRGYRRRLSSATACARVLSNGFAKLSEPADPGNVWVVDRLGQEHRDAYQMNSELYGDYSEGRWIWLLSCVRPVEPPIEAVGRRGVWTLPPHVQARLEPLAHPEWTDQPPPDSRGPRESTDPDSPA